MKTIYKVFGTIIVILLLNLIFVSKNKGKYFVNEYIKSSQEIKIKVNDEHFSGKFTHESYLKQILIFKGIYGNIC